jgi:hypothetical protein
MPEINKLTGFVPERIYRNMKRILKVSLMESIPGKWFPQSVIGYQYTGDKTIDWLAHDDSEGLFNMLLAGEAFQIDYERVEPVNYNHVMYKTPNIQGMGSGLGVSFGLALENLVSLGFSTGYYNYVCVSNNSEGKTFKAFVPSYVKPVEVQGYKKVWLPVPATTQTEEMKVF